MKKTLVIWLLIVLPIRLNGQDQPLFDSYFTNNYLVNPAITGIDPFPEFQLTKRSQWTGIEGAPENWLISFHTSLGNSWAANSHTNKVPGTLSPYPTNTSFKQHLGLGVIWYHDRIGPYKTTYLSPSVATHLPLKNELQLSLGISANITRRSLDLDFLRLADPNDPLINSFTDQTSLTMRSGFVLSSKYMYIGAATSVNSSLELHHSVGMIGGRIEDKKFYVSYSPFMLFRYSNYKELNIDLGLKVEYKDSFFLGGLARTTGEFSAFVGANLMDNRFGFTYSFNTGAGRNKLSSFQNNTMELSLIYRLSKNGFLPCPRKTAN